MNLFNSPYIKPTREAFKVYHEPVHKPEYEDPESKYVVAGVDLGQACDYAAISILERTTYKDHFVGPPDLGCRLVYCRRWQTGTDYCELAEDLLDQQPNVILLEMNGVGRPVVDIVRAATMRRGFVGKIKPIVTAASSASMQEHKAARGDYMTLPKKDLVSSISIMGKAGILVVPGVRGPDGKFKIDTKKMPELINLEDELRLFQMKYSDKGNLLFGNKPGAGMHDDLVVSLGLACFWMLSTSGKMPAVFMG